MKTTRTAPAKKTAAPKKKNASVTTSTPRVAKNIYLLTNGMYNGRKMINGERYSQNFKTIKLAKAWLTSL